MQVYFREIRNRCRLVLLSQSSSALSLFCYKDILLFSTVYPVLTINNFNVSYFIITDILELILVYLDLMLFFNKQIMSIVFLYHFFMFLAPAWYKKEYIKIRYFSKVVLCLGLLSNLAIYFILLPLTWLFFIKFYNIEHECNFNVYFEPRLIEYLDFYTWFYWGGLGYFQSIALLFWLVNLPYVTFWYIQAYRKICYFCFAAVSLGVCPDELSQLIFIASSGIILELSIVRKLIRFR